MHEITRTLVAECMHGKLEKSATQRAAGVCADSLLSHPVETHIDPCCKAAARLFISSQIKGRKRRLGREEEEIGGRGRRAENPIPYQ